MKKDYSNIEKKIIDYGGDIVYSEKMQKQKSFIQHGNVSVYEHSVFVAIWSLRVAIKLNLRVNERALVRGALLHDYFLYDWHEKNGNHKLHGFRHAKRALKNASEDFSLCKIEKDIIVKHMFPLNLALPKYKESVVVWVADKWCALCETLFINKFIKKMDCKLLI